MLCVIRISTGLRSNYETCNTKLFRKLFRKDAGSRGFNCALRQYSTDADCCIALLVTSHSRMAHYNSVLDYVKKIFESKDTEHYQHSFLEIGMYSFILNCKVNTLFYTGCISWQICLFSHMGNFYYAIEILFYFSQELNAVWFTVWSHQFNIFFHYMWLLFHIDI